MNSARARKRPTWPASRTTALAGAALLAASVLPTVAFASGDSSLTGSNFEIEANANLVLDSASPSVDWASVTELRQLDKATGSGDDSFGQGSKEDSAVPTVVDGSIPPNKSDLKAFGVYQEGTTSDGFLHLYWTRVQDPSGTTNMDFEFNQSSAVSGNGVTPVRTAGDLLIQYDLSNGGSKATISTRTWGANSWGSATTLSDSTASGTINSSAITVGSADGLGALSARTFGEASLRLSAILPPATESCNGFGSAYLKSRSSDTFNSALKDFIAPIAVNITNCGSIIINKDDDAGNDLNGAVFTLYNNVNPQAGPRGAEDTLTAHSCTTAGAGTCTISNVPFGSFWAVETTTPAGYDTAADQAAVISGSTPTVTLNFVDPRQRGAVKITKTRKDASAPGGSSAHAGVSFTLNGVTQQTNASGVTCFDNLLFGSYSALETVPANYQAENGSTTTFTKNVTVDNKATCAGNPYVGESVAFVNTPLSNITVSFASPVTGLNGPATAATIACTGLTADPADATPSAFDDVSETFKALAPGTYTCTVVVDP